MEKNHDRIPAIHETWGLSLVLYSPLPEDDDDVMGGADLTAEFFRALSGRDISPGEDELTAEEDYDNDEDKEEMERRRGLL